MFQSIPKYFQIITGNDKFSKWKSTWLSEESNKTLATSYKVLLRNWLLFIMEE